MGDVIELYDRKTDEAMDRLLRAFFAPPPPSDFEYELTLSYISEIMTHA